MPRPQSGSSGPTLRKSQRPCGRLQKSYIPSQPYEIAKNGEKKDGFAHILAYKSPKTKFFALKYLTGYTHETFFEEYTNFEAHYLSRCRDIPLQSFGSHIRPQPYRLGLIESLYYLDKEIHFSWPQGRSKNSCYECREEVRIPVTNVGKK